MIKVKRTVLLELTEMTINYLSKKKDEESVKDVRTLMVLRDKLNINDEIDTIDYTDFVVRYDRCCVTESLLGMYENTGINVVNSSRKRMIDGFIQELDSNRKILRKGLI